MHGGIIPSFVNIRIIPSHGFFPPFWMLATTTSCTRVLVKSRGIVFPGVTFNSHTPTTDYDTDKDGLIEVSTLSQLDAIRCDLDGDGRVSPKNEAYFGAAFPLYPGGSDYAPIACAGGCRGYELVADLDFEDANNDGTANDASKWAERGTVAEGWRPIGGVYLATFEGNHHVICNLYINRDEEAFGNIGLFAEVSGSIQNLGLADVDVRGRGNVGSLAGVSTAHVQGCYVRDGSVEGNGGTSLGGLLGTAGGGRRVVSSYSHVLVQSGQQSEGADRNVVAHVGGLVGLLRGGTVIGSYAQGDVFDGFAAGGLVGTVALPIDSVIASYATGRVSGNGVDYYRVVGGLVGSGAGSIVASYADPEHIQSSQHQNSKGGTLAGEIGSVEDSHCLRVAGESLSLRPNEHGTAYTAAQFTAPTVHGTVPGGIYYRWNRDLNGRLTDASDAIIWDFGTSDQCPALRADLNGDGIATVAEFGLQRADKPQFIVSSETVTVRDAFGAQPVDVPIRITGGGAKCELKFRVLRNINKQIRTLNTDGMIETSLKGNDTLDVLILSLADGSRGRLVMEDYNHYDLYIPAFTTLVTLRLTTLGDADEHREFGPIVFAPKDGAGDAVDLVGASINVNIVDTLDDHGDTAAEATPLVYVPGEEIMIEGVSKEQLSDTPELDFFSFTAPEDGTLTVTSSTKNTRFQIFEPGASEPVNWLTVDQSSVADIDIPARAGVVYAISAECYLLPHSVSFDYEFSVSFTPGVFPSFNRYDMDRDNLIEVSTLAQLNAIRYDLDGDGEIAQEDVSAYLSAFPLEGVTITTGPHTSCSRSCLGYELVADLDFEDANGDGVPGDKSIWAKDAYAFGVPDAVAGWTPLGRGTPYTGAFEGNYHIIRNLCVSVDTNYAGLFGRLQDGTIRNVGLEDVEVSGGAGDEVGSLVGIAGFVTIEGCYATGSVTGTDNVGGLVGSAGVLQLHNSYASVDVLGEVSVGGLVGWVRQGSEVSTSYATGRVTGHSDVGGFAGLINAPVTNCYATGTVTQRSTAASLTAIGGFAGTVDRLIRNSYALGDVFGAVENVVIGQFAGDVTSDDLIEGCYYSTNSLLEGPSGLPFHTSVYGEGRPAAELRMPTTFGAADGDLYFGWGDADTALSDAWDLGKSIHYPALKADFNGDDLATASEFGSQGRVGTSVITFSSARSTTEDSFDAAPSVLLLDVGTVSADTTVTLTLTSERGAISASDCTLSLQTGSAGSLQALNPVGDAWVYELSIPAGAPFVALEFSAHDKDEEDEVFSLTLGGVDSSQLGGVRTHTIEVLDASDDHGSSLSSATPVEPSPSSAPEVSATGHITPGDVDTFSFTLSETTFVTVYAQDVIVRCTLLNATGGFLSGGSSEGATTYLPRRQMGAGTYYIQIEGHTTQPSGTYTLFILTGTDDDHPDRKDKTHTPVQPTTDGSAVASGYLSPDGDEDCFIYRSPVLQPGIIHIRARVEAAAGYVPPYIHLGFVGGKDQYGFASVVIGVQGVDKEGTWLSVDASDLTTYFPHSFFFTLRVYNHESSPEITSLVPYEVYFEFSPVLPSYDTDADGLIEVHNLAQLNAIRYDLDGDGVPSDDRYCEAFSEFPSSPGSVGTLALIPCSGSCRGYELAGDLDFHDANGDGLSGDPSQWAEGTSRLGWAPLKGSGDAPYTGVFDGNHHAIRNLYISRGTDRPIAEREDNIGLFGLLDGAEVCNVGLEDANIRGENYVGALVGDMAGSTLEACYATGAVRGKVWTGGLVGTDGDQNSITSCYASADVRAFGYAGGLAGVCDNCDIIGSYATGAVSARAYAGGLFSWSGGSSSIVASYATGDVSTTEDLIESRYNVTGGLAGYFAGTITASYATGTVRGPSSRTPPRIGPAGG